MDLLENPPKDELAGAVEVGDSYFFAITTPFILPGGEYLIIKL